MRAKHVRLDAVCAAAVALVAARVWLVLAPGQAVRWGSRIGERDVTGRGSLTGRGLRRSGEDLTGRGLRGSHFAQSGFFPFVDLQDPRPAEDPQDPRKVGDLRPVENPRAPLADARIRDLSRAVIAVGARPPLSATCLELSLALVMLLALARIPAHLLVGVARLESSVRAHAWVECGGRVILGGAQAAAFVPLLGRSAASAPSVVVSSCPG